MNGSLSPFSSSRFIFNISWKPICFNSVLVFTNNPYHFNFHQYVKPWLLFHSFHLSYLVCWVGGWRTVKKRPKVSTWWTVSLYLNTYDVSGTLLNALRGLSHLGLVMILWGRCYWPHITDNNAEAHMVKQGHTAQKQRGLGLSSKVWLQNLDTSPALTLGPSTVRQQQWTIILCPEGQTSLHSHILHEVNHRREKPRNVSEWLKCCGSHKTLIKVTWLN